MGRVWRWERRNGQNISTLGCALGCKAEESLAPPEGAVHRHFPIDQTITLITDHLQSILVYVMNLGTITDTFLSTPSTHLIKQPSDHSDHSRKRLGMTKRLPTSVPNSDLFSIRPCHLEQDLEQGKKNMLDLVSTPSQKPAAQLERPR